MFPTYISCVSHEVVVLLECSGGGANIQKEQEQITHTSSIHSFPLFYPFHTGWGVAIPNKHQLLFKQNNVSIFHYSKTEQNITLTSIYIIITQIQICKTIIIIIIIILIIIKHSFLRQHLSPPPHTHTLHRPQFSASLAASSLYFFP